MKTMLLFFPCRYHCGKTLVDKERLPLDRYRPIKEMDIWARHAVSVYRQTRTIGSGLDEIAGNKKAEVKLEQRYQF